jgi:hypothetical protein
LAFTALIASLAGIDNGGSVAALRLVTSRLETSWLATIGSALAGELELAIHSPIQGESARVERLQTLRPLTIADGETLLLA